MSDREKPPPGADPMSEPSEPHTLLTAAIQGADRVVNQADAMRLQLVCSQWDRALQDEAAAGRVVLEGGAMERAFAMHLASTLTISRPAASLLLAKGLMLRDELPATLAVFVDGRCTRQQAFLAVDQLDGLNQEQTAWLDRAAAGIVGTLAPAQLERQLERLRTTIAPDVAIDRARRAATTRSVSARPCRDGMGALMIRSTGPVIAGLYDAIHQAAVKAHGRAGETRTFGVLMADAGAEALLKGVGLGVVDDPAYPGELLGTPEKPGAGAIQAQIVVVVPAATATGLTDEAGELAGMGALDAETARHVVAVSRSWMRTEVDPISAAILAFDTHDRFIPAALRKLIQTRQPTCSCGCNRPTHRSDLDHVWRFEHDGRTRHTNLQGLCRPAHAWLKDGRYMDVKLLPNGDIRWRDAWGGIRIEKPMIRVSTDEPSPEVACPF